MADTTIALPDATVSLEFLQQVKEAIEQLSAATTAAGSNTTTIIQTTIQGEGGGTPDLTPPPGVTGWSATAGFARVILQWDYPSYGSPDNHAYSEIDRIEADGNGNNPGWGSPGIYTVRADSSMWSDAATPGVKVFYRIRHVSKADVAGAWSADANATPGLIGSAVIGANAIADSAMIGDAVIVSAKIAQNNVTNEHVVNLNADKLRSGTMYAQATLQVGSTVFIEGSGKIRTQSGDSKVEMTSGDVVASKNVGGTWVPYKSLNRVETGQAENLALTLIPGYFFNPPSVMVSPASLQSYSASYPGQNQSLNLQAAGLNHCARLNAADQGTNCPFTVFTDGSTGGNFGSPYSWETIRGSTFAGNPGISAGKVYWEFSFYKTEIIYVYKGTHQTYTWPGLQHDATGAWSSSLGIPAFGGKTYWDVTINAVGGTGYVMLGISTTNIPDDYPGHVANSVGWQSSGGAYKDGINYGLAWPSYGVGDRVGFLYDGEAHTLTIYKNDILVIVAATGLAATTWYPALGTFENSSVTLNLWPAFLPSGAKPLGNMSGGLFAGIATASSPVLNTYLTAVGDSYGIQDEMQTDASNFRPSDTVGIGFDADARALSWWKNGVLQGTVASGITAGAYFPAFSGFNYTHIYLNANPTAPPAGYSTLQNVMGYRWVFTPTATLNSSGSTSSGTPNERAPASGEDATNTWYSTVRTAPSTALDVRPTVTVASVRGTGASPNYYYRTVAVYVEYYTGVTWGVGSLSSVYVGSINLGTLLTDSAATQLATVAFGSAGAWQWRLKFVAADAGGTFASGSVQYNYGQDVVTGADFNYSRVDNNGYVLATVAPLNGYSVPGGWEVYSVGYSATFSASTWVRQSSSGSGGSGRAEIYGLVDGNGNLWSSPTMVLSRSYGTNGYTNATATTCTFSLASFDANAIKVKTYNSWSAPGAGGLNVALTGLSATVYRRQPVANSTTPANHGTLVSYIHNLAASTIYATGSLNWMAVGA